jgi:hypothetical protein
LRGRVYLNGSYSGDDETGYVLQDSDVYVVHYEHLKLAQMRHQNHLLQMLQMLLPNLMHQ